MTTNPDIPQNGLIMGSAVYDKLKFVALVLLPALGSLYFALSGIWGFPNAEQVVGSIVAIDTFLGALIHISSTSFNNSNAKYDGAIHVHTSQEGGKLYTLEVEGDPEDIDKKKSILFKVKHGALPEK